MPAPKKRPAKANVEIEHEEEELHEPEREDEGDDEDDVAPLFFDQPGPKRVKASLLQTITLKREKNGVFANVPMSMGRDPATRKNFVFKPSETTIDDIGRVFGPGRYQAVPMGERGRLVGARYEFVIDDEIRQSPDDASEFDPSTLGFRGARVPKRRDDESEDEEETSELDELRAKVEELTEALRGGGGRDRAADDYDRTLTGIEGLLKVRDAAGINTPTAQTMLKQQAKEHDDAMAVVRRENERLQKALTRIEEAREEALAAERKAAQKAITKTQEDAAQEIADMRKKHAKIVDEHEDEIRALKKKHQNELDEESAKRKRSESAGMDELDALRRRLNSSEGSKDDLDRSYRQRADAEARRVQEEADRRVKEMRGELEAANAKRIKDVADIENALKDKVSTLEKQRDAARDEVVKLKAELAEIPEEGDDEELFPPGTPKIVKQVAPAAINGLTAIAKDWTESGRRDRQEQTQAQRDARAAERARIEAETREKVLREELERVRAGQLPAAQAPVAASAQAPVAASVQAPAAPTPAATPAPVAATVPAAVPAQTPSPAPSSSGPFIRPPPESRLSVPAPATVERPSKVAGESAAPAAAAAAAPAEVQVEQMQVSGERVARAGGARYYDGD